MTNTLDTEEEAESLPKEIDHLKCRNCGYTINFIEWKSAKYDYSCPGCSEQTLIQFESIYKTAEGSKSND